MRATPCRPPDWFAARSVAQQFGDAGEFVFVDDEQSRRGRTGRPRSRGRGGLRTTGPPASAAARGVTHQRLRCLELKQHQIAGARPRRPASMSSAVSMPFAPGRHDDRVLAAGVDGDQRAPGLRPGITRTWRVSMSCAAIARRTSPPSGRRRSRRPCRRPHPPEPPRRPGWRPCRLRPRDVGAQHGFAGAGMSVTRTRWSALRLPTTNTECGRRTSSQRRPMRSVDESCWQDHRFGLFAVDDPPAAVRRHTADRAGILRDHRDRRIEVGEPFDVVERDHLDVGAEAQTVLRIAASAPDAIRLSAARIAVGGLWRVVVRRRGCRFPPEVPERDQRRVVEARAGGSASMNAS